MNAMAFIPALNTARVETIFLMDSETTENVYHVQKDTPWSSVELVDLTSVFIDWWDTRVRPIVSNNISLRRVKAIDLSAPAGIGVEVPVTPPILGGQPSEMFPNNVTVAIKWNTGRTGRSYRGRTYHMGLFDSQVVNNRLTDLTITALTNAYGNLLTDLTTFDPTYKLVVASFYSNNAPRTAAELTPIITATVDPITDSQRRRLPQRGS
jgi:hypothetical protein